MENTVQTETTTAEQPEKQTAPKDKKKTLLKVLAGTVVVLGVVWCLLLRIKHAGTKDFNGNRWREATYIYGMLRQYSEPTLDDIRQEIPHGNYFARGSVIDGVVTVTPEDPDVSPVQFTLPEDNIFWKDKELYFCFRMDDKKPLYVNSSLRKGVWDKPVPRVFVDICEPRTMSEFYLKTCVATYTEADRKELAPYLAEDDPVRQLYCGG